MAQEYWRRRRGGKFVVGEFGEWVFWTPSRGWHGGFLFGGYDPTEEGYEKVDETVFEAAFEAVERRSGIDRRT